MIFTTLQQFLLKCNFKKVVLLLGERKSSGYKHRIERILSILCCKRSLAKSGVTISGVYLKGFDQNEISEMEIV